MVGLQEARPCYVEFYYCPVENRAKSIEQGMTVYDDVPFAKITPPGGKLVVEKNAADWLKEAKRDPFFPHYDAAYRAFLNDEEIPVSGTRLENWPAITPAQLKMVKAANIKTVEDLAAANEEALRHIGMGGRALKDKADAWLRSAQDVGKVAERLAALEALTARLETEKSALEAKVAAYEADRPKVGRPRKVQE